MTAEEAKQRIEALTRDAQAKLARQREEFSKRMEEQVADIRRKHQPEKALR